MMNKKPICSMEFYILKTIFYYKQCNIIICPIIIFKDIDISIKCKTRPPAALKSIAEEIYDDVDIQI